MPYILIVKAMEERLNERWEFYYDNRLKHPSEEQEENIRQIDFHKISQPMAAVPSDTFDQNPGKGEDIFERWIL